MRAKQPDTKEQSKELGKSQADGSVGLKTIEAMKAVKK